MNHKKPKSKNSIDKQQWARLVPLDYTPVDPADCLHRSKQLYQLMNRRRSVRHFSDRPVSREIVENLIRIASTAPSGAHKQPWSFIAVSDSQLKSRIRAAAETEERRNYENRMPQEWRESLSPLGTDWQKPYLETAPWLVVVFQKRWEQLSSGERRKNYYGVESVGIAVGMFIAAVHQVGLAALTHTPSPMNFLTTILNRPSHERPFVLIPVGYPSEDCMVPDLRRKTLEEVAVFHE